ncbi:MAG: hypothetical protein J6M65_07245 [Eubacterium sp.]|nr:hypothetical protein [Eubacterium sp.]
MFTSQDFNLLLSLIVYKFGPVIIYLIALIIGFVLSNKRGNISGIRKVCACLILAAGIALEYILPHLTIKSGSENVYIIITVLKMLIRFVAIVASLYLFSDYFPSRLIIVIFVILAVIYCFKTIYLSRIMYDLAGVMSGKTKTDLFLSAFFNNRAALTTTDIACLYISPVMALVDCFTSVKKKIV